MMDWTTNNAVAVLARMTTPNARIVEDSEEFDLVIRVVVGDEENGEFFEFWVDEDGLSVWSEVEGDQWVFAEEQEYLKDPGTVADAIDSFFQDLANGKAADAQTG